MAYLPRASVFHGSLPHMVTVNVEHTVIMKKMVSFMGAVWISITFVVGMFLFLMLQCILSSWNCE